MRVGREKPNFLFPFTPFLFGLFLSSFQIIRAVPAPSSELVFKSLHYPKRSTFALVRGSRSRGYAIADFPRSFANRYLAAVKRITQILQSGGNQRSSRTGARAVAALKFSWPGFNSCWFLAISWGSCFRSETRAPVAANQFPSCLQTAGLFAGSSERICRCRPSFGNGRSGASSTGKPL